MIRLLENIKKEFKSILNLRTLMIALVAPLSAAIFFLFLYGSEISRNLPVGVYDADRSELSRTLIRYVNASNYMNITEEINSLDKIKTEIQSGNLQAVFVIPKDLEKDIKSGKPSTVVVYKNTSNIVTGNMILKDAATIIRTVSAGIFLKKIEAKGRMKDQAEILANSIKIESKPLFNPNYSYSFFLVPGLIFVTLQLAAMLSSVNISSSSVEVNNLGTYIAKLAPHSGIQIINFSVLTFIILPIFNIILYKNFLPILFLYMLLILSSVALSILISLIFKKELLRTEVVLLMNTPAFLFCGLTYPLNLMPDFHIWFAQTIPFTHFLEGFLKLFYMDGNVYSVSKQLNILLIYTAGITTASLLVITLKKRKTEVLN